MALVIRKALFESFSPYSQIKRFRGKINLKRPQKPHYQKALYLEITKPWYLSPYKDKTPQELCKGVKTEIKVEEENPLQRFIAQDVYEYFTKSKLVVFFHVNPFKAYDQFKAFALFKKNNMIFKQYGRKTMEMAIKGTPYEAILEIQMSQNMVVFSPEPDIKTVLKITKKFHQLVIIAGIYEGRFVSKDELVKYSEIPNIEAARVNLLHTLSSLGSQLVSHLNRHQMNLISNLEARAKQLQEK